MKYCINKNGNIYICDDNINMDRQATQEEIAGFQLKKVKSEKLNDINDKYLEERNGGYAEYNGMRFSIHDEAQQNLTSSVLMAQTFKTSVVYFEKNGQKHSFTLEEFLPVSAAIAGKIQDIKNKKYSLEASINNALTMEELDKIKW